MTIAQFKNIIEKYDIPDETNISMAQEFEDAAYILYDEFGNEIMFDSMDDEYISDKVNEMELKVFNSDARDVTNDFLEDES